MKYHGFTLLTLIVACGVTGCSGAVSTYNGDTVAIHWKRLTYLGTNKYELVIPNRTGVIEAREATLITKTLFGGEYPQGSMKGWIALSQDRREIEMQILLSRPVGFFGRNKLIPFEQNGTYSLPKPTLPDPATQKPPKVRTPDPDPELDRPAFCLG